MLVQLSDEFQRPSQSYGHGPWPLCRVALRVCLQINQQVHLKIDFYFKKSAYLISLKTPNQPSIQGSIWDISTTNL